MLIIGITLAEHEQRLKSREAEIRAELENSHTEDQHLLRIELKNIEQALQDTKASYEALVKSLKERIAQLEAQRKEWPDKILDEAIEALQSGNTEKADRLFQQVEDDSEKHIKRAAEAAYQRGKIAEDRIRYADALKHYENAIRLQPENGLYLNEAGLLHIPLANYQKAIEYIELALDSDLKTFGENHFYVARTRNYLGVAWDSLGKYNKAIKFYEFALDNKLETLGENHPDVAAIQNNLESAQKQQIFEGIEGLDSVHRHSGQLPDQNINHIPENEIIEGIQQYRVELGADPYLEIPGVPGELRVWIGYLSEFKGFPKEMHKDSTMIPAIGKLNHLF